MDEKELAKKYLEQFRTKSDDLFWAYEQVDEFCHSIDGAKLAVEILNLCETNEEIAYVAAGPVEDLLKRVGSPVIPFFEQTAKDSEKVKIGLSGAWIGENDSVFNDWKRLMVKFGYWGNKPMSPLDR
jgi:hypothetical protein